MFKKSNLSKRLLALLLTCILVLSFQGMALAADGASCLTATGTTSYNTTVGALSTIELTDVFSDSESHNVTYSITSSSVTNDFIKIQNNKLYFTASFTGTETVTVQASCSNGKKESVVISFNIESGENPLPVQFNYNQTPAESVTVYVTVSSDGVPLLGNDSNSTALCHLKVTVPYFNLGLYGLEDYYRYEHDESGSYCGDEVIQRPTALHLYIYLLERYYFGLPESECCKGGQDLSDTSDFDIMNMWGEEAYDNVMSGLYITGSATSMYMQNFWGHDENLMYYRNHAYPLQRAGWGSTADYILLSENDTIDLAMFTNWGFYTHGAFLCLGDGETTQPVNDFNITAGETLTVQDLKFGTQAVAEGGVDNFLPMLEGASLFVAREDQLKSGNIDCMEMVESSDPETEGSLWSYTFEEPGVYYLIGLDDNIGTEDACYAPATARVVVTEPKQELTITEQPENYVGALYDAVTFNVTAVGDNLSYKWYYKKSGSEKWGACSSGNKASYSTTLLAYRNGYQYRCKITDGEGNVVTSEPATMSIDYSDVVISRQPVSVYGGSLNGLYEFNVVAEGTNLAYQWYVSQDGGETWKTSSNEGAKTPTLKCRLYGYRSGYQYRCQITSGCTVTVTSEAAEMKLQDPSVTILEQPASVTAALNSTVRLHVEATGNELTYRWYASTDQGETWVDTYLTGHLTDTMEFTLTKSRGDKLYRCVVTDGSGKSLTSSIADIRVRKNIAPIQITEQPASVECKNAETVSFHVAATGTDLLYQWYVSTDEGSTWKVTTLGGNKTDTLSFTAVASRANGKLYRCMITDTNNDTLVSDSVSITLK